MEYNLRIQAHYNLRPTSSFTMIGEDIIDWDDDENDPPTTTEIDAEVIRLQAEHDAQEYARNRSTEYPALAEQLDEIYHNGIASWKATIKVTKDKYPKG